MEFERFGGDSFASLSGEIQRKAGSKIKHGERRAVPLLGCSDEAWRQITQYQYRSLAQLPEEVLLLIMKKLSPDCLWAVRQTSSVFFRLFQSRDFSASHGDPTLKSRQATFLLESLTADQRQIIRKHSRTGPEQELVADKPPVSQDGHRCASCAEVHQRGEHDPRLINLRQLYFCDACQENHAGIFFPAQSLRKYLNKTGGSLVCIGRLGLCTLCSHSSHAPVTWHAVEQVMLTTGERRKKNTFYQDPDHMHAVTCLKTDQKMRKVMCAFPRLEVNTFAEHADLRFGWDLPLFDMDAEKPPPLPEIRDFAAELIRNGALRGLKCCQHVVDRGQLQEFTSSICLCFEKPGYTKNPGDDDACCMVGEASASQGRQVLECEECAGDYAWRLISGRLFLSYRYGWEVIRPVSLGWLGILDSVPALVYSEENKHLLWCDDPACSTGQGKRWMEMVKEETWLQTFRFGDIEKLKEDFRIMRYQSQHRHQNPDKGYQMPPLYANASYFKTDDAAEELLRQIRAARKQAIASTNLAF
ncbi:uncharacterized protein F5Z01DRAFT_746537 [Emericellopsis atlantica]|uniref:F-box domain-containing protein n=1 Tax=Emericellopsis atlantica TaxID=2614577 RepID=A0A9P7ZXM4_9HYPO|nr:uncharacterized protein F5Z01DRAFT_746537 [Emericellopsis atlantica]KAG9259217.1 hypothetical protein F5Z01DRAFT_746537 [Emericellopsis atlantica]